VSLCHQAIRRGRCFSRGRSEIRAGLIEKFQKLAVERAGAVGFDEPLLPGFAGTVAFLARRLSPDQCCRRDFITREQIQSSRAISGYWRSPAFPFADVRLIEVRFAADDVDF